MNFTFLTFAIIQLVISILLGVAILFICFQFINRYSKKKLHMEDKGNEAFALLVASVLFSVGYLMETIIHPIIKTFRLSLKSQEEVGMVILKSLGYLGIYFVVSSVFAFLIVIISFKLFDYVTDLFWKLDEMKEIKKNNISIGIITAVVIIVMAMLTRDGLELLVEALVPMPEFNRLPQ